ncbi:hypothetical protein RchiOBHm_Chr6g0310571 [Rosa chinensis]|uniref:Uncharacterized protein n=1 Tax=Rosa chinensis TaxID=74649 RepID=A0A2P6Q1C4_ROSCH|nr:hypothetical protein RchiOBHm_Chr6g0310571 [Rosa chinensis]
MEMTACMVKNEHFGSKIGKNDEPALLGSLSQLPESIESVSSLPPPSIQTSSGPAQLMSPTRSLVPEEGDVVQKKIGELTELDNISTTVGNYFQYALPKCCGYGRDIGTCSVVNVFNALCVMLTHYIESPKKISHYVLQLCFSGFDKKVRDKGSTLLTNELFMEYFAGTMASGNSLKFTFSLIMTLIELWSYGYVEKNIRWFTKISVISFGNGCFDFHHDHGLISCGIEFNSFLVNRNDGHIVVLCPNMFRDGVNLEYQWETKGSGHLLMVARPLHVKLLKNDVLVSNQFYGFVKELEKALAILLVSLLKITADIRKQIELLHGQAKMAELYIDLKEVKRREELLVLMGSNNERNKKNKGSIDLVIKEVIDFVKINSEFSSSRYFSGLVVPITTFVIQAVLVGNVSHVFGTLSVFLVNKLKHKKESLEVICLATIFFVTYVLSFHMQLVDKCMPPQIVEFTQHYITKKELVTFWIWVPTTLSSSKVWILNSHGLIVIKGHLLIGDIFRIRELIFYIESHITPTGAIATGLVFYSGEELHITNSDSHMVHYNMCLRHTKCKVRDIISNICLRSSMTYEEEISKLEVEAQKQTGSGRLIVVCNLNNLISFVSYCNSMVFVDNDFESEDFTLQGSTLCNRYYDRSSSSQSIIVKISDEFRFPKSGNELIHVALIPNYELKSLLHQCSRSWIITIIFIFFYISIVKAANDTVKLTAEFLVILNIENYFWDAIESWLNGTLGKNGSCEIKWGGNFTKQGSLDYGADFGFGL